jgi:L-threonylcarbamoyladenylate synthase
MTTPILLTADPQALLYALTLLHHGALIALPTDTVYGIAAHGLLGDAVEKIYIAKGRPSEKAIPLLLASADDVLSVAREVPPVARRLMARFWPGALTLVLKKQPHIPLAVTNTDRVAVRVPDHPFVRELIRALGAPLAATSANKSGQPELLDAQSIVRELGDQLDLILDGGMCKGGVPSTIVDVTVEPLRVLRVGAIPESVIQAI